MEILLTGCNPAPLAAYLKALGILRLVAGQVDDKAKGYWRNDSFVLQSKLNDQALMDFFISHYQPTPIIAPWNGGSGFYYREEKLNIKDPDTGKKIKTGVRNQPTQATRTLEMIIESKSQRFKNYRNVAQTCREIVTTLGFVAAPKEEEKRKLLIHLRASLPDEVLIVLDAALTLNSDKPGYAPLLGTGWNDGNLDFSNNFMQRLVDLFDLTSGKADAEALKLLNGSLFDTLIPGLKSASIGQFSPGAVGGPNATTGFNADSLINPWDFVFMLEGALLFAAASTRRMESTDPGVLSYPFTVQAADCGEGSTESNARAEIWLPLWKIPINLVEIKNLFSEGRVTLGRKPVRDGLDFVRAISRLGVERGINAFQRYAFVMRSGKSYLATPLVRVSVTKNPSARLIDELDANNWLYRFRKLARDKDSSARIQSLVRQLGNTLFDLARHSEAQYIQPVLIVLGQAQQYLRNSPSSRQHCPPVPILSEKWIIKADDKTPEYQLARALAGLHARTMVNGKPRRTMFMAGHFAPLEERSNFRRWDADAHYSVVWGINSLEHNLFEILKRRLMEADKSKLGDKPLASNACAPLSAIFAWLNGTINSERTAALLSGLVLARLQPFTDNDEHEFPLSAAYAVLKPLFCTDAQLHHTGLLPRERGLSLPLNLLANLRQNPAKALAIAVNHLRAAGCSLWTKNIGAEGIDGQRLLAVLMVPVSDRALTQITSPLRIKQPKEPELTS